MPFRQFQAKTQSRLTATSLPESTFDVQTHGSTGLKLTPPKLSPELKKQLKAQVKAMGHETEKDLWTVRKSVSDILKSTTISDDLTKRIDNGCLDLCKFYKEVATRMVKAKQKELDAQFEQLQRR